MRSKERRTLLVEALQSGQADVLALAHRFGVSASTVRRDLQRLSDQNAVVRTYGGAVLAAHLPELSLGQRLQARSAEKQAIALAAIDLVEDGDTLLLDTGTTVLAFASLLRGRRVRVVTPNLAVIPLLAGEADIELIVLGGAVRAASMGTIGPLAIESLERLTADRVFMSGDGLVAKRGLCEASLDQAFLKSMMIRHARDVVVLADATKLGRAESPAWTPLPSIWTLVTDAVPEDRELRALQDGGARPIFATIAR